MTTLINDYNVNYKVHRLSNWYHTGRMKKDRLKISTTVFLAQTTAEKIGNGWDYEILWFYFSLPLLIRNVLFYSEKFFS